MTDAVGTDPAPRGMNGGKVALVVIGALVALIGFATTLGGGVMLWAHATQRDSAGFYTTSPERFATSTSALTSEVDLGRAPGEHEWTLAHPVGTIRVRVTSAQGEALFVGIAPHADVDRWLTGVAHEHVVGVNFGPFHSEKSLIAGNHPAASPLRQGFWAASASGPATQTLLWPSEGGHWTIVVMNADGRAGVNADVAVGAKTGILLPIGIGFGGLGLLLLAVAAAMFFFGLRGQRAPTAVIVAAHEVPVVEGTYPARLDGHLDPELSRWLWLVKWLLVIPHVVVLAFLWLAVALLTLVAGFAILFTGRYPRAIFDFNVGVMRWTWRVSFYAFGAFGTDRYPPFSLRSDPEYPADFTVDYPEHLSRGLVLVKWWLLALPHYLIVAVFAGGWAFGRNDGWRIAGGGGLISLLAIIAVVVLAVKGRYPTGIFDFVMGMNRWCYRVLVYAALMRDEYPPFRVDSGGRDPGSVPVQPAPPVPDRGDDLIDATP